MTSQPGNIAPFKIRFTKVRETVVFSTSLQ